MEKECSFINPNVVRSMKKNATEILEIKRNENDDNDAWELNHRKILVIW